MITRDDALARDAADPLHSFLDEFVPPPLGATGKPLVYLDGNSLGRPPKRTIARIEHVLHAEWADSLIRSWNPADPAPGRGRWLDLPQRVGDLLAPLIGAGPGEVVVHDSTTVNIYQLVVGALALRPDRSVIAIDAHDFPTDRYVVDGIAAASGHTVRHGFEQLDDVAVVLRSVVDYRTSEVVDVAAETARAHAAGALVIWDLSHTAGVLAIDLRAIGAQLAVGCTYKFLNGGPGSPAFSYVARELHGVLSQPIWGWFSQQDQFAMGPVYTPRDDIGRMLLGTPTILSLAGAEAGISVSAEAGIDRIQDKARALTGFALELCDQLGLSSSTPRDPLRRGGHVNVVHPDARTITQRLCDELGVLGDFREPDVVRLGMSPLTTSYADVFDGLVAVRSLIG